MDLHRPAEMLPGYEEDIDLQLARSEEEAGRARNVRPSRSRYFQNTPRPP